MPAGQWCGRGIGLAVRRSVRGVRFGKVALEGVEREADLEGGVARHAFHGAGSTGISAATDATRSMSPLRRSEPAYPMYYTTFRTPEPGEGERLHLPLRTPLARGGPGPPFGPFPHAPQEPRRAAQRERVREIARIGSNLNQIARWANTYKDAAEAVEVVAHLAAIERTLDEFEKTAWAGLDPDRYAWSAVLHRENNGGVHVHVLAARCDLETGRSLNIAPPGWQRSFDPLRDALNHEHGWSRPA